MLEEKVYSVSNINKYIKMVFDKDTFLSNIIVKGEITNFKLHSSGHLYFTLKDEFSTIKCIMFKNATLGLNFNPKDGDQVVIKGAVSVYEVGGTYQIYVRQMAQDGIGELYEKFEALKKKLQGEGLFDASYKKALPYLPKRVGVISSSTGAVIRDIINVSTRRFNNVNILLYPAAVQGDKVPETVIKGIEVFNTLFPVDVIIIARGGGSFEDLFGFNDETLARAVFDSKIPIVSAVGHETDFTICDFVSDLRAPTPSAAAELVYPSSIDLKHRLDTYSVRLTTGIKIYIERRKQYLKQTTLVRLEKTPRDMIAKYEITLDNMHMRLVTSVLNKLNVVKQEHIKQVALLDSYSPLKTLARGYSVLTTENGKLVSKISDVEIGDNLSIKLQDGRIAAKVGSID